MQEAILMCITLTFKKALLFLLKSPYGKVSCKLTIQQATSQYNQYNGWSDRWTDEWTCMHIDIEVDIDRNII